MKQCDFDDKAEAMVLFEDGQLDYLAGSSGAEMKKTMRIKILSDKGLNWANVFHTEVKIILKI